MITIKAARERTGLSVQEAAAAIGTTADTLRSWECGKTHPRLAQCRRICKLYSTSFDRIDWEYTNLVDVSSRIKAQTN